MISLMLATLALAEDTLPTAGPDQSPTAGKPLLGPVMRPWGQLQVFTTLMDQDSDVAADPAGYGDPEADPGFQIARARFGFTGILPHPDSAAITAGYGLSMGISTPYDSLRLGDSGVSMVDAFFHLDAEPSLGHSRLAVGLVKVPFSRESLMSSQDLVFMERSVGPENLTSVRDVGVVGSQVVRFGDSTDAPAVVVSGGTFNGNADFLGDRDPGLMYGGRLEFAKGDTYRTWNPEGGVAFGAGISGLLNDEVATRTTAWNSDLLFRAGPLCLQGELGQAKLRPTDATVGEPEVLAATTRTSWMAQASVFTKLKGVQGIEFAARASGFDDNARLDDNGDVLILHAGAIWRSALPMLDVGAGFIHREELQGVSLPNDTIRIWTQVRPRGDRG